MNVPTVYYFNCEVSLLRTPTTVEALAIKDNSLFCLTTYFDSTWNKKKKLELNQHEAVCGLMFGHDMRCFRLSY